MKSIINLIISSSLVFFSIGTVSFASPSIPIENFKIEHAIKDLSDQFLHTQNVVSSYSKGNEEVLNVYKLLCSHLNESYCAGEGMIDKDIEKILVAIEFAAFKHRHQTRKNPQATPYIIHPIGVADHLLIIGYVRDPDILIGALLHDTVEDTDTSFEEIRALFGSRIENFVREVTDDKSLSQMERKTLQIMHAPEKSAGAAQIKLADKFYNLNDLLRAPPADWEKERIDGYFDWAEKVVHALPWVNGQLLNAVDRTIANYRHSG